MPCLRRLKIKNIRVTDYLLSEAILESKRREHDSTIPEVWKIHQKYFLSDGHHTLRLISENFEETEFLCHSSKESFLVKKGYEHAVNELIKKAEVCELEGVLNIYDLSIV